MTIHSICGLMNSGKTLYMTYRLFIDYCQGRKIISNYDLNFPHTKINRDVLFLLGNSNPDLRDFFGSSNLSMGFDELWLWLDCRESVGNRIGTYFFLQSSKDDINIFLTAQSNSQNEKRIRDNLHFFTNCDRRILQDNKFSSVPNKYNNKRFLPKDLYNSLYIQAITHKRNVRHMSYKKIQTLYIYAKTIARLYDTRQKMRRKHTSVEQLKEQIDTTQRGLNDEQYFKVQRNGTQFKFNS